MKKAPIEQRTFDDIEVGERWYTDGRTFMEADIQNFVCQTGMFEELFINMVALREESVFPRQVVPGVMTFAYAEGLFLNQMRFLRDTAMAFLGVTELRVVAPLFVNDTIRTEIVIAGKKETSKPDRGIITFHHFVYNEKDELVLEYKANRMIRRR